MVPMRTFTDNEPLTDAELDRLGDFFESCKGNGASLRNRPDFHLLTKLL